MQSTQTSNGFILLLLNYYLNALDSLLINVMNCLDILIQYSHMTVVYKNLGNNHFSSDLRKAKTLV